MQEQNSWTHWFAWTLTTRELVDTLVCVNLLIDYLHLGLILILVMATLLIYIVLATLAVQFSNF